MSRLGPLTFGKKEEQIFLGREIAQHRDFCEETARQIDLEVRRLIDEAYQSAHSILEAHKDAMHRIAAALLERETIDAEEVKMLIEGKELPPMRSVAGLAQRWRRRRTAGAQARDPRRLRLPGRLAFTGITPTSFNTNGPSDDGPFVFCRRPRLKLLNAICPFQDRVGQSGTLS